MPIYFVCGIGNTLFFMLARFFAKKPRVTKALFIARKTCFYSFIITVIVLIFGVNLGIGITAIIKSLFPIIFNKYWVIGYYVAVNIAIFAVCILIDKLVTIINNKEVSLLEKLYNKIFSKNQEQEQIEEK